MKVGLLFRLFHPLEKIRQMKANLDVSKPMFFEDKERRVLNIPRDDKVVKKFVVEFTPAKVTEGIYNKIYQRFETAKTEEQTAVANLAQAEKKVVLRTRRRIAWEIVLENVSPELEQVRDVESERKKINRQIGKLEKKKRRLSIGSTNLSPSSKAFKSPKRKKQKTASTPSAVDKDSKQTATPSSSAADNSKQVSAPSSTSAQNPKPTPIAKRIIDLNEDDYEAMDVVDSDENYDYTQDEESEDE